MTRLYSNDLRERVVGAVAAGQSSRAVADRFDIAVSSIVKWSQRYRATGSVSPGKMGGYRPAFRRPNAHGSQGLYETRTVEVVAVPAAIRFPSHDVDDADLRARRKAAAMCHASRLVGNRDQHAVHVLRPIESCKHGRKRSARSFLLGNERPCIAREGQEGGVPVWRAVSPISLRSVILRNVATLTSSNNRPLSGLDLEGIAPHSEALLAFNDFEQRTRRP